MKSKCKTCGTTFDPIGVKPKCNFCGSPNYVNLPLLQNSNANYLLRDEPEGFSDPFKVYAVRRGTQSPARGCVTDQPKDGWFEFKWCPPVAVDAPKDKAD